MRDAGPRTSVEDDSHKDAVMAETFRSRPPVAPRIDKVIEQAGRTRNDPYAWIKADNWQAVMQDPGLLPQDIRAGDS